MSATLAKPPPLKEVVCPVCLPPAFWRCRCGRTLGEIIDGRVIIRAGDRIIRAPLAAGLDQVCPRCGSISQPPQPV